MLEIMQGDSYRIPLSILIDGLPMTPDNILEIEVIFSNLRKTYTKGGIIYDNGFFIVLSQKDTLNLIPGLSELEARVKLSTEEVYGAKVGQVTIIDGASREVL